MKHNDRVGGCPSIHPRPGNTVHAQDLPTFKTRPNHSLRTETKFTGNWHSAAVKAPVKSCWTRILMSHITSHLKYFPGCRVQYQTAITSARKNTFLQRRSWEDGDVYVQMLCRWENSRCLRGAAVAAQLCKIPGELVGNLKVPHMPRKDFKFKMFFLNIFIQISIVRLS